jgi:hypothetical protein
LNLKHYTIENPTAKDVAQALHNPDGRPILTVDLKRAQSVTVDSSAGHVIIRTKEGVMVFVPIALVGTMVVPMAARPSAPAAGEVSGKEGAHPRLAFKPGCVVGMLGT